MKVPTRLSTDDKTFLRGLAARIAQVADTETPEPDAFINIVHDLNTLATRVIYRAVKETK